MTRLKIAPPNVRTCRPWRVRGVRAGWKQAQCLAMMSFTGLPSVPTDHLARFTDQLRLAVAAYLARFKGSSRYHTESDLRCYLTWCAERGLDPLAARRPHLELHIRWMQEIRRFKPSTVSRRFSVAAGFYRTCVIDGRLAGGPVAIAVNRACCVRIWPIEEGRALPGPVPGGSHGPC